MRVLILLMLFAVQGWGQELETPLVFSASTSTGQLYIDQNYTGAGSNLLQIDSEDLRTWEKKAGTASIPSATQISIPAVNDYVGTYVYRDFAIGSVYTFSGLIKGTSGETVRLLTGSGSETTITLSDDWVPFSLTRTYTSARTSELIYFKHIAGTTAQTLEISQVMFNQGNTPLAYERSPIPYLMLGAYENTDVYDPTAYGNYVDVTTNTRLSSRKLVGISPNGPWEMWTVLLDNNSAEHDLSRVGSTQWGGGIWQNYDGYIFSKYLYSGTTPSSVFYHPSNTWIVVGMTSDGAGASSAFRVAGATTVSAVSPDLTGGPFVQVLNYGGRWARTLVWPQVLTPSQRTSELAKLVASLDTEGIYIPSIATELLFAGDSITLNAGVTSSQGFAYQVEQSYEGKADFNIIGTNGGTMGSMLSDAPTTFYPWVATAATTGRTVVVHIAEGTNDIVSGRNAADTFADLQSFIAGLRTNGATKIVVATMLPRGDANTETRRQSYNDLIRNAVGSSIDALADWAANTDVGDYGDNLDLTYYQADGIHPNAVGHTILYGISKVAMENKKRRSHLLLLSAER